MRIDPPFQLARQLVDVIVAITSRLTTGSCSTRVFTLVATPSAAAVIPEGDVRIEPDLQPLTGEVLTGASSNSQDGARLDIAANGFWGGRYQRTYLDVRVFNPHAASNRQTSVATCYRKHEAIKKRAYEQRIREVEHSSFTPLVLSATGSLAVEATTFYKRLAACLADKWEQPYSSTLAWLRSRLTFPTPSLSNSVH